MVSRIHHEMRLVLRRISPCQLVALRHLQLLLSLLHRSPKLLHAGLCGILLGFSAHFDLSLGQVASAALKWGVWFEILGSCSVYCLSPLESQGLSHLIWLRYCPAEGCFRVGRVWLVFYLGGIVETFQGIIWLIFWSALISILSSWNQSSLIWSRPNSATTTICIRLLLRIRRLLDVGHRNLLLLF